jgi:hypothetical protein
LFSFMLLNSWSSQPIAKGSHWWLALSGKPPGIDQRISGFIILCQVWCSNSSCQVASKVSASNNLRGPCKLWCVHAYIEVNLWTDGVWWWFSGTHNLLETGLLQQLLLLLALIYRVG